MMAEKWLKRTLEQAICRDCKSINLISIEDRFKMREWKNPDGSTHKFSPRECLDCHAQFDVITLDNVVIAWSGKAVEFLDDSGVYVTRKEAWDMGIRHGFKNPYK